MELNQSVLNGLPHYGFQIRSEYFMYDIRPVDGEAVL